MYGDEDCQIHSVSTLSQAGAGQISFLTNSKYRKHLMGSTAEAVILTQADSSDCPINALVVNNPHAAYAKIATLLNPPPTAILGIAPTAYVDPTAQVDETASIGHHCVIEAGVKIGKGVRIGPGCVVRYNTVIEDNSELVANVTINYGCRLGARVLLHPGVVIGADGFGQANDGGIWIKVPQLGSVVIEDDVEIGANSTVDRGAIDDTVIGKGVKLDNLIQVAHNVHIGEHSVIAACTAIAGSTHIGKGCVIGGCVGIVGHLEITDNVMITGMSMVTKSITEPGSYSSGLPAEATATWHKSIARFRLLEKYAQRLKAVEVQLQEKNDK